MPTYIKVDSIYKVIKDAWVKEAGTWVLLEQVKYKAGGLWSVVHKYAAAFAFYPTLTGTVYNYNLREAAIASGWDAVQVLDAHITLSACTVHSVSSAAYAFTTGFTFPEGSTLRITLNGSSSIIGRGGTGGDGGGAPNGGASVLNPMAGSSGNAGGPALLVGYPCTITNAGIIAGGGGGGGGGGIYYDVSGGVGSQICGGATGGGGGAGIASGGNPRWAFADDASGYASLTSSTPASSLLAASSSTGDTGYAEYFDAYTYGVLVYTYGGRGGAGGSLGSAGAGGTIGSSYYVPYVAGAGAGGAAGASIMGYSLCTINNTGSILGPQG